MLLSGKKIIITGGLTGIGRASAKRCVEYGANVITMSRKPADHPSAVSLIEELRAKGTGSIDHMQVDVEDRDCVFEVFDKAIAQLGGIDVLINSAGKPQRVNALSPSSMTEMAEEYLAGLSKEEVDAWEKWMRDITPLPPRTGVVAPSEDVAGTVVFLASDLSINMTGQIVSCDNGQLMVR